MSARSAPQILSIKGECTFLLLNFVIIDLSNSSANSLVEMFSFLTVPPEIYKPLKPVHVDIHDILDF